MATVQNVNWLASNIETDTTHRLVTDEQIEKWNKASENKYVEITTDRLDLDTLPPGKWYWKWKYDSETGEEIANQIYGSVYDAEEEDDNLHKSYSVYEIIKNRMSGQMYNEITSLCITTEKFPEGYEGDLKLVLNTPTHTIIINSGCTEYSLDIIKIGSLYYDRSSVAESNGISYLYYSDVDCIKRDIFKIKLPTNSISLYEQTPNLEAYDTNDIKLSFGWGRNLLFDMYNSTIKSDFAYIGPFATTETFNLSTKKEWYQNYADLGFYYVNKRDFDDTEFDDFGEDIKSGVLLNMGNRQLFYPDGTNTYFTRYRVNSVWTGWKRVNII